MLQREHLQNDAGLSAAESMRGDSIDSKFSQHPHPERERRDTGGRFGLGHGRMLPGVANNGPGAMSG